MMNVKVERTSSIFMMVFFFLALSATFKGCLSFSFAKHSQTSIKSYRPMANNRFGSSVLLQAFGTVYPLGYFSVNLEIGSPKKLFDFDVDTGSVLTWVQCDAPICVGCTKPPEKRYKPQSQNFVPCSDPLCAAFHWPATPNCEGPDDRCDYEIHYVDHGSSRGVLVADTFPIRLINGTLLNVRLAFGCGCDQQNPGPYLPPDTAGVLGLGIGKISIVSKLRAQGVIKDVAGHCISGRGGGFLFLGDDLVPYSKVAWTLIKYYKLGSAELLFAGKSSGFPGLQLTLDSGSSYTYFSNQVYQAILALISKDLPLKLVPDTVLPICWEGPFGSITDVKKYFKPLTFSFTNPKPVQLHIHPEAYLIISVSKNVCLGILNSGENGLGDTNLIGENFMQDKMVIYDNEQQQLGWVSADCNSHI